MDTIRRGGLALELATGLGLIVLLAALAVPAAWLWRSVVNVDTGGQPLGARCQRCESGNVSRMGKKYVCHDCGHVQEAMDWPASISVR
jgi:hypothetical protein